MMCLDHSRKGSELLNPKPKHLKRDFRDSYQHGHIDIRVSSFSKFLPLWTSILPLSLQLEARGCLVCGGLTVTSVNAP